jgi:hypothetical protein
MPSMPGAEAGIPVDERFGASMLRDANEARFTIFRPVGNSWPEDIEYGEKFTRHGEAFGPTFRKELAIAGSPAATASSPTSSRSPDL